MDPREKNLPLWARQIIDDLRHRLEYQSEPLLKEVARLRPQMEKLKACNEAMTELLECAARGGHRTSQEIVQIIEQYDLALVKKEG